MTTAVEVVMWPTPSRMTVRACPLASDTTVTLGETDVGKTGQVIAVTLWPFVTNTLVVRASGFAQAYVPLCTNRPGCDFGEMPVTLCPEGFVNASEEAGTRSAEQTQTAKDWLLPLRLRHSLTGIALMLMPPGVLKRSIGGPAVSFPLPFYTAELELTGEAWARGMQTTSSEQAYLPVLSGISHLRGLCRKLNANLPSGFRFGIPTPEAWEYAARAGVGTLYTAGNNVPDLHRAGWFTTNSDGALHPGGRLAPNAWGLYDVHGNAPELCMTRHETHTSYWAKAGSYLSPASQCSFESGAPLAEQPTERVGLRLVLHAQAFKRVYVYRDQETSLWPLRQPSESRITMNTACRDHPYGGSGTCVQISHWYKPEEPQTVDMTAQIGWDLTLPGENMELRLPGGVAGSHEGIQLVLYARSEQNEHIRMMVGGTAADSAAWSSIRPDLKELALSSQWQRFATDLSGLSLTSVFRPLYVAWRPTDNAERPSEGEFCLDEIYFERVLEGDE